jgi:hypothetical protein
MSGPWDYDVERERNKLKDVRDRYFRSVIKFPTGHLTHFGDCEIHRSMEVYGYAFCSCGLLHDLRWIDSGLADKLYPKQYEELGRQNIGPKLTPEEIAANMQVIEAAFVEAGAKSIQATDEEWAACCKRDWNLIEEVFGREFRERTEEEWIKKEE